MATLGNFKKSDNDNEQQYNFEYTRIDKADILNQPLCFSGAIKRQGDYGDYWIVQVLMYGSMNAEGSLNVPYEKVAFLLPSSESRDKLLEAMNAQQQPIHYVKLIQKEFTPKGKKTPSTMYTFIAANEHDCPCTAPDYIAPADGVTFEEFEAGLHGIPLNKNFCLTNVLFLADENKWKLQVKVLHNETVVYQSFHLKSTEGRDNLFNSMLKTDDFPVHDCRIVRKSFTPKGATAEVSYYDLVAAGSEVCVCGEHLGGPEHIDLDDQPW